MIHEPGCDCGAYACELRAKGIQISPAATPSLHNRIPPRAHDNNSWEKGIAGEHRTGGVFMPYIGEHDRPMRMKEYAEGRHRHEQTRRRQLAGTVT